MRALLPALFLLAACTGGEDGARQKSALDAQDLERVVVRVKRGALKLDTGEAGKVTVDAHAPGAPAGAELVHVESAAGVLRVEPYQAYADTDLELELTVPPGIDVTAVGSTASISLSGSWNEVRVLTGAGPIVVDADGIAGGKIESSSGKVSFATRRPPERNLTCKSVGGDADVALPGSFRGRIHISTQTGRCEVQDSPELRVTWDPGRKSALAFHGQALTEEERRKELDELQSPRAIWIESAAGTASFRIAD